MNYSIYSLVKNVQSYSSSSLHRLSTAGRSQASRLGMKQSEAGSCQGMTTALPIIEPQPPETCTCNISAVQNVCNVAMNSRLCVLNNT